ncbi:MAG: hypothetical protein CMN56_07465 [Sneathiella sp.]|uniref:DUF983 domain-containing protein n=1 Tax=Sneathiella sp. TaxID=1964365 RepID=UPI000C5DBB27|nr:DUF983 domain-containing protein [Sneathiella sp.]MAZ02960.1 hypothetical protein [Sneathiella sp.]
MPYSYGMPVSPFRAGLTCKCPACGKGKLFSGFLDVAESCDNCGQDFSAVNSGDGPAVFIIFIVGFIVAGLAVATELIYHPPYWVQLTIWLPMILILSLGLLRPFKAYLIALQFKHKASSEIERY